MDEEEISASALAAAGDCSETTINMMRRGEQLPSLGVAAKLVVFSREQGSALDILDFFPG